MKNKNGLFKKMTVVMKGFSTVVLAIGAICLIMSILFSIIGYDKTVLTIGELLISSVMVMIIGAAGEDLFDNVLYRYQT